MKLRRNQIEAQALQAIEAVLAGGRAEDDRIECKANWPDESKARQLAGHANSARGEPIIWLIGIDEKNDQLAPPSQVDPADWWARVSKRFDQVAPEMIDLTVNLGEGRTVTALAFSTDQAPYVVTASSQQGRIDREVPVRVATGTRSAYRHELLRLLLPTVALPQAFAMAAEAWTAKESQGRTPKMGLTVTLFLEHPGGTATMLPAHGMQARLEFDAQQLPESLRPVRIPLRFPPGGLSSRPTMLGVDPRPDGLMITGSGAVRLQSFAVVGEWGGVMLPA